MKRDEEYFDHELKKFSVVQECPQCGQLSLSFKKGSLHCSSCGFEENMPTVR